MMASYNESGVTLTEVMKRKGLVAGGVDVFGQWISGSQFSVVLCTRRLPFCKLWGRDNKANTAAWTVDEQYNQLQLDFFSNSITMNLHSHKHNNWPGCYTHSDVYE